MQFWRAFDISRFRSCFCAPGKGARCAFCTCRRMFRKGSQSPTRPTFETALAPPGTQNRGQESLRQAREGPELHRRASMERKIVPERSPKDSQKTRNENSIFSKENHLPGGKMLINTEENITSQSKKNNPCISHVNPPPSALRPPDCPMMPRSTPKAEKSFLDPGSRILWKGPGPARAQRARHTFLRLQVLPGATSLAWD